jgi:hypothetical protein
VNSWRLRLRIRVRELSYQKIFRLHELGQIDSVMLSFDGSSRNRVQWSGDNGDGTGDYEVLIDSPYRVQPRHRYRLEVIMNPKFNATPNINNPALGYYGPTYGVEFE